MYLYYKQHIWLRKSCSVSQDVIVDVLSLGFFFLSVLRYLYLFWLEQVGHYYRRQKNQSLIDLFFDLSLGLPEARGTLSFTKEHDYFKC